VWTSDGRDLLFTFFQDLRKSGLYRARADGSEKPQLVVDLPEYGWPTSVSRDGIVTLMYSIGRGKIATLEPRSTEMHVLHPTSAANEQQPAITNDGKWLAYVSDETGQNEVYVEPYPAPAGKLQASVGGGMRPRWSADGRTLFYNKASQFFEVPVAVSGALGKPKLLFEKDVDSGGGSGGFDVTPDGQRFLVTREIHPQKKEIVVMIGWQQQIR
jgi:Tol biopolymer transport system component